MRFIFFIYHIFRNMYIYIYEKIYVYMIWYMYIWYNICIYNVISVDIYIYIYIYIYTHIYIYLYIHETNNRDLSGIFGIVGTSLHRRHPLPQRRMFGAKVPTSLVRLSLLLAAAWRKMWEGIRVLCIAQTIPKTHRLPSDLPNFIIWGIKTVPLNWGLLEVYFGFVVCWITVVRKDNGVLARQN